MGASSNSCPKCKEMMNVGKLTGWNEETKKSDIFVALTDTLTQEHYGISVLRCPKCHHVELTLD